MWAVAASVSENYSSFEGILYERARRYIQDAEMKVIQYPPVFCYFSAENL
jgi:hypothetical protein